MSEQDSRVQFVPPTKPSGDSSKSNTNDISELNRIEQLDPADAEALAHAAKAIRFRGSAGHQQATHVSATDRGFNQTAPSGFNGNVKPLSSNGSGTANENEAVGDTGSGGGGGGKSEMKTAERSRLFSQRAASWRRAA